ncbi:transglutaminase domain-containing protein [Nocardioides mangrovicus]|uniref:Transglutaminase domain-containing protein n=1 Tax=Nocardioides mangrovicus TaxID=2478913 RepID=A0A3L8P1P3_9ACTN|nr:DUF3488 and transglutaminase-like domain-containing protein [Nocardioides mangrovicus]RLV48951.1 transglutaminase domain-containing protein [Nocardioides mangrovicus]
MSEPRELDPAEALAHLLAAVRGLPFALLGGLTAWVSVVSWHGMVEAPLGFLVPLLVATVVLVTVGWAVRRRWQHAGLALLAQLVVVLVVMVHRATGSYLPTPGGVVDLWNELVDGALAGQRYVSPVSTQHPEFAAVLLLGGLGIAVAVDLLACGVRHAALAGLPLLLAVTVSASVLLSPVSWLVFALVAIGWLALISLQESSRLTSWESTRSQQPDAADPGVELGALAGMGGLAARIGAFGVVAAVLLTAGITSQGRQLGDFGAGNGNGTLTTSNPMLDMRRNLRESADVPLVTVRAKEQPAYLRLTVLDDFTGDAWQPFDRTFDNTSVVATSLPPPAGLSPLNQGTASTWRLSVSRSFPTRWLPVPYVTSVLNISGSWRYSADTLDVISGTDDTAAGLSYSLTTYQPLVDPSQARAAGTPPATILRKMTDLPTDLPLIFKRVAQQVTAGATNSYDQAVALQNWFRSDGGFTYSTKPSSGTGTGTLERFITTDKVGYCEQFSTAMALMARTLGIPSRVSVGFLRPTKSGSSTWTFGTHDLHAWPELYFNGVGWIRFEPTPGGRTGSPPDYTADQTAPTQAPTQSASANPTTRPSQAKPSIAPNNSDASGQADSSFPWRLLVVVLVLLLLVALALLPRLLRRAGARRRWAAARSPAAVADAAWTEVRATAIDLELGWVEGATVRGNGERLQRDVVGTIDARDALREVVSFVELTRYAGPRELPADLRERLQADVAAWTEEARRSVDPRRARRARWWPRSIWKRG